MIVCAVQPAPQTMRQIRKTYYTLNLTARAAIQRSGLHPSVTALHLCTTLCSACTTVFISTVVNTASFLVILVLSCRFAAEPTPPHLAHALQTFTSASQWQPRRACRRRDPTDGVHRSIECGRRARQLGSSSAECCAGRGSSAKGNACAD